MRKVTYGAAVSLDGFIADPDEALDWLRWTTDAAAIAADSFMGVDTLLMGRRTFEFGARSGGAPWGKMKAVVFSRTLSEAPQGVTLIRDDAAGYLRELKGKPGGDIIVMGGGGLAAEMIEAGVVDEVGINLHPVLLGRGAPLFGPMARRMALELIEARAIAEGCVLARYRVAG